MKRQSKLILVVARRSAISLYVTFGSDTIGGDGFKLFALASLLPATAFDIHLPKMGE
jgi:hypothetical protein